MFRRYLLSAINLLACLFLLSAQEMETARNSYSFVENTDNRMYASTSVTLGLDTVSTGENEVDPSNTPDTSISPSPSTTPEATPGNTALPEISPTPATSVSPSPDTTFTPPPVSTPSPSPSPSPGSTATPNSPPLPPLSPSPSPSSTPTVKPADPSDPIVTQLPPMNPENALYIQFKNKMLSMVKTIEKSSGIGSAYGVFIMDLKTGFYCGVRENLTNICEDGSEEGYFNSASVIKLFQGYIVCDMVRRGELSKDTVYYDKVTNRKFKLLDMISTMISYSDNNYSNATLRLVGMEKSNEVLKRLGISNSRFWGEMSGAIGYSRSNNLARYGTTKRCARLTPQDAGLILYNIYQNREKDPFMKIMNSSLLGNVYNTRIPVGINRVNASYKSAHKTGTNTEMGIYNDAGIIYSKHPFILVAFTQSTTSTKAHTFIRKLSEDLTRYFDKLK